MTSTLDDPPPEPAPAGGQILVPAPPLIERGEGVAGVLAGAVPMLGGLGSILVVALLAGGGSGSTMRTRSLLAGGVFLLATVTYVIVQVDRQRRQHARQLTAARADHLDQLSRVREQARAAAAAQRQALTRQHPSPLHLPGMAEQRTRLWRRAPGDDLFLVVRIGRSTQPLAVELVPPTEAKNNRTDPVALGALLRFIALHTQQRDLPCVLDLHSAGRVQITGPHERQRALARALVCHAAVLHSPAHLNIAVLCPEEQLAQWDWIKWLPHSASPSEHDAIGPRRLVCTDPATLGPLLGTATHVLLITEGRIDLDAPVLLPGTASILALDAAATPGSGAVESCLDLSGPSEDGQIPFTLATPSAPSQEGYADQLDLASAEACARRLAPLPRPGSDPPASASTELLGAGPLPPGSSLTDLLDAPPADQWEPDSVGGSRQASERLRVPIGIDDTGQLVQLDLKEPAQQGMGPHGLVIGATGSGKSELLRTLVLGLAMTHSPDQLNLVLVDFKGGATFAGFADLPHTSAVITNLASELTLVDRMQDALNGEMIRRQELLRAAGNHASARDYERARMTGEDLAPLPSLFIVVDEFSELLSVKPEFIELFVAIGRLGRSLGLHLLLASQRLEEGRLRGLEAHLSYRIGLRTFSASESRTVLGVPDAHTLPAAPGLGYLRPDPNTLTRFRSAFVSGPVTDPAPAPGHRGHAVPTVRPFTVVPIPGESEQLPPPSPTAPPPAQQQPSLLETLLARMEGRGTPAHQVWLPPLDRPDTLDRLMPDLRTVPGLGLVSPSWRARPGLQLPVGTVDRPRDQRRGTLVVDLAGAGGHAAVVGGPRSGRSTLLRSLVSGLALTRTPYEVQFFILDLTGGGFGPLASLPHVSGSANRSEPDVVRRVIAEVTGILDRRERLFSEHGIDSIETYRTERARHAAGGADGTGGANGSGDGYGDVVLVIDGWATLRTDFEDLEQDVGSLASRGLTFGVHLVVTSSRWADFRSGVRDVVGTRLELRLGDPTDSSLDRKAAARVPAGRPGRGLSDEGLHVLMALPRIDGDPDPLTVCDGSTDLQRRINDAWSGPSAPPLRLLPTRAERVSLLTELSPDASGLLLGVDEKGLSPVLLHPDDEPHLLVLGDGGSGKSTTLRGYLHEVQRTRTPRQAQIVVVDYRRSLLGEVCQDYLLNYLTSSLRSVPVLADLAEFLRNRLPSDDVTPEQLRHRSWWTGAEVHVVVDDYDLVTGSPSPLTALQPLLAQARDVGLHVVVARRSGGAARSMYDPVLQSLRDLAQPGLLLSGDPEEGPLLGRLRPQAAPPGRGRLLTRDRGLQVLQVAWSEPNLG